MSDIKLFRIDKVGVAELKSQSVAVEKSLQNQIERNLEAFLGIRFLATEYPTGKKHSGRIDTLGIDENGCPVIIEYKRATNENVINQGLFYLDWLMDHKGEFKLLAMQRIGNRVEIDWSSPRLLCIAGDYTKYDEYAVQQINRNIELIRYRRFGSELILLELVNSTSGPPEGGTSGGETKYKTVGQALKQADENLVDVFEALKAHVLALGDDIQVKELKYYFAFKRLKNFVCVEVSPAKGELAVYVKVDPKTVKLKDGFTKDVSKIGHFGTGDLRIALKEMADLEKAKPLLLQSYEAS